ncbi:5-formyltetrahydrofolate cyclo-ligase [Parapedobacter composti]|uniref:5-formyltetrahydrofolate cyclo-ligase n=1 Tax=Parapedobacter composti TaxID=623281 RepID=A0A1I1FSB4_9SPHI|nr:5-formyltetrahydrofolate cyclo-ligase [Parapedobacter composti]SFC01922.1 5-formyltetrahydrofolate cyclo-ligase [Parapedobacter composti]
MTLPATKSELRKQYREKRINLSDTEFVRLNGQLLTQLKQLDFSGYALVHLFLPILGNREPDTFAVAAWLKQQYPAIRLAISRSDSATAGMQHVLWDEATVLTPNRWGIPEPQNGTPIEPAAIDAVLVPLLAFDTHGNRVGYGKGFYDRFLRACRADTQKIGLSLFDATPRISDVNAFDVRLDRCVTPYRIWQFDANTAP